MIDSCLWRISRKSATYPYYRPRNGSNSKCNVLRKMVLMLSNVSLHCNLPFTQVWCYSDMYLDRYLRVKSVVELLNMNVWTAGGHLGYYRWRCFEGFLFKIIVSSVTFTWYLSYLLSFNVSYCLKLLE